MLAGAVMGATSYAGGQVYGTGETPEERMARKEEHRRRFRRPYQEMVNEIGEGRGKQDLAIVARTHLTLLFRHIPTWLC